MKNIITEEEKKRIRQMHSMDESFFGDLIDKIKTSDTVKNIKNKFSSLIGVDSDEKKSDEKDSGSEKYDGKEYGKVTFVGGGMNDTQKRNMNLILKALENAGIDDPKSQIGILSVIKKESNFKLQDEIGYCNTSDGRILDVFGSKRGGKCKSLKCDNAKFFDCLYGYKSGVKLGNTEPGDGYKYLGRGFHGLTGKANYKKYGISDPFSLSKNVDVAAKEVADFFKRHDKDFSSVREAVTHFNNINSGGSQFGLQKALSASENFEVK
jgi:predicted chitinase